MGSKSAQCSGPHDCHDCNGCLGGDLCRGYTQDELWLGGEKSRLVCLLLDRGMTLKDIRAGQYSPQPTLCLESCGRE